MKFLRLYICICILPSTCKLIPYTFHFWSACELCFLCVLYHFVAEICTFCIILQPSLSFYFNPLLLPNMLSHFLYQPFNAPDFPTFVGLSLIWWWWCCWCVSSCDVYMYGKGGEPGGPLFSSLLSPLGTLPTLPPTHSFGCLLCLPSSPTLISHTVCTHSMIYTTYSAFLDTASFVLVTALSYFF